MIPPLTLAEWEKRYSFLDDELISTAEAAEILGVSVATVKRHAATGKIDPAHKMRGKTGAYLFPLGYILDRRRDTNPKQEGNR